MADVSDKVMEMVEKELAAAPDTSTTELFELAKRLDPAMKELSVRQFHARYPLQVKRKKSLAKGGGRRKKQKKQKKASSGGGSSRGGRSSRGSGSTRKSGSDSASGNDSGSRSDSGRSSQGSELHGILVEFAKEVSAANDRGPTAMLDMISNLDNWVARVEKTRG